MCLRLLPILVVVCVASLTPPFSIAQTPDLFPEAGPPLVVPNAEPKRESPFLEEAEPLRPPRAEASKAGVGSLNNLFSHQWVQTNGTGALKGTVVTLSGDDTLSVSGTRVILSQRGRIVANTTSNPDGEFYFGNVSPGFYSIIAEADNSFATFGLAVLSKDSGAHLPTSLELRVIRPKGESLRRILGVDLSPNPVSGTIDGRVQDPLASKRIYAKSHRILSSEDGRVNGRLSTMGMAPEFVDMSQMKAVLLKDGNEIGRTDVAMDGTFHFNGVAPGCYGFLAVGNRGVAAVAFCVIKPETLTMRRAGDGKLFVSAVGTLQDTASPSLNVELADGADVMSVQDSTTEDEVVEEEVAPFAIPPMGGQFGAGQIIGGGGGGLGGLVGDLAGLGALGLIAAVVANELDDDDGTNNNAPPITSPITSP